MGMNTHVYALTLPTDAWTKKKKAFDACVAAGITPPAELRNCGFEDQELDTFIKVDLEKSGALKKYSEESKYVYRLEVDKLPVKTVLIEFVNSF